MGGVGGHHPDPLPRGDLAVDHPDVGDHAAVGVVDRVEDHRTRRRVGNTFRRRDLAHHLVEHRPDALTGLGRHPQHILRLAADDVRELGGVLVRLGGRQVDLVEHRDDLQVVLHGEVQVRQRLRLDALCGVDQQHRAFAGRQRPADLVGEVDVPGGVDHVQHVVDAVRGPRQAHVLRLDRDAPLPLDVHPVEILGPVRAFLQHTGQLQHAVGQR